MFVLRSVVGRSAQDMRSALVPVADHRNGTRREANPGLSKKPGWRSRQPLIGATRDQ